MKFSEELPSLDPNENKYFQEIEKDLVDASRDAQANAGLSLFKEIV